MSLSAALNEMTLSDIPAALFSSLGLIGGAIARKETRFAGYVLILSAVFIRLSVPIADILLLLYLYYTLWSHVSGLPAPLFHGTGSKRSRTD
jgi:hypothetical protein